MARFASILGVFIFAVNALDQFDQGHTRFGVFLIIVSVVNLLALVRMKASRERQVLVLTLNAVVGGATAIMYFRMGKQGLPWTWLIVMVGYGIAAWRFWRKKA